MSSDSTSQPSPRGCVTGQCLRGAASITSWACLGPTETQALVSSSPAPACYFSSTIFSPGWLACAAAPTAEVTSTQSGLAGVETRHGGPARGLGDGGSRRRAAGLCGGGARSGETPRTPGRSWALSWGETRPREQQGTWSACLGELPRQTYTTPGGLAQSSGGGKSEIVMVWGLSLGWPRASFLPCPRMAFAVCRTASGISVLTGTPVR